MEESGGVLMDLMDFSVPCLFGLEGLVGEELRRLKLADVRAENGSVRFRGGWEAMAAANLRMRMGERVLLRLGAFPAHSFEELFQGVKALPLEDFIPKTGRFPVKGHCLDSQLHSVPDCQAIVKKAAVERLGVRPGAAQLARKEEVRGLDREPGGAVGGERLLEGLLGVEGSHEARDGGLDVVEAGLAGVGDDGGIVVADGVAHGGRRKKGNGGN
jgi:hypothetical protein